MIAQAASAYGEMPAIPQRAHRAATYFVVYGVLVLLNAGLYASSLGHVDPAQMLRAGVRVLGVMLIASGLKRGARWAWLLGAYLGGFWLLLGVIGLIAMTAGLLMGARGLAATDVAFVVVAVAVLGMGWVNLIRPEVRHAFRKRDSVGAER